MSLSPAAAATTWHTCPRPPLPDVATSLAAPASTTRGEEGRPPARHPPASPPVPPPPQLAEQPHQPSAPPSSDICPDWFLTAAVQNLLCVAFRAQTLPDSPLHDSLFRPFQIRIPISADFDRAEENRCGGRLVLRCAWSHNPECETVAFSSREHLKHSLLPRCYLSCSCVIWEGGTMPSTRLFLCLIRTDTFL